ncbi:tRNA methyltransferase 10 homolog A-like [Physella acuta]|uniref:tRNA methyltransferase 10 homolog A-like n=1 Tax=Physella acuta TaxID=109671 RepID=UPI0027DC1D8D|nr:tRNA methyltransferase 10 homolog A-like [Physella acuta]
MEHEDVTPQSPITNPIDLNDDSNTIIKPSKNQLKKQRKREKWLAIKKEKRHEAKQKRKRRLAELREKGEDIGPNRKRLKSNTMKNSSCKIRVVIDLSFDDHMTEKDVNSLTCQLQHSYSANRRAQNPLQLYLCGLSGKTKERLDSIGDYKGWDVHKEIQHYEEVFPKSSLVYLSSESPNVLTSLSDDKVYIIGGLVDHNKLKGLCLKIAEEKGIAHAQLPISDYLNMKTRKVLAINHVFSILLRYTESNDWKEAFLAEMPQRKQAYLKDGSSPEQECHASSSTEEKPADIIQEDRIENKGNEEISDHSREGTDIEKKEVDSCECLKDNSIDINSKTEVLEMGENTTR